LLVEEVFPRVDAFKPDMIFVSAGFDAHAKDLLNHGYGVLREEDYGWGTGCLLRIANRRCRGRLVSVLEGGYTVQGGAASAFARSALAHVNALASGVARGYDAEQEAALFRSEEATLLENKKAEAEAAEAKRNADSESKSESLGSGAGSKRALDRDSGVVQEAGGRSSKRRRRGEKPVDYVALNAAMDAETGASAKAAKMEDDE